MFDGKDPKIKLFGKTIKLPETGAGLDGSFAASKEENDVIQDPPFSTNSTLKDGTFIGESLIPNQSEAEKRTRAQQLPESDRFKECDKPPIGNDSDNGALRTGKPEEDQSISGKLQDRTLKKPDKIVPCPRCNSMETKFCYFNNYNVNQPRHFCKNCQRYWTAGGTMRNVPVGAGRRKNKTPATPQFRLPEASVLVTTPNGSLNPNNNGNTVLTFNSDTPLCESMATGLNLADKKTIRNGFHQPEELVTSVSHSSKENGDERTSISPVTILNETGKTGFPVVIPNCHPFPWPYPWNSVQWTPPTFSPPSFPLPFYPNALPPYWGCAVPPVPWTVPWVIPPTQTTSQSQSVGSISPTLGKHSRDDNILKHADENENTTEKCLWVPKTLRIDDPGEAAKSSIWETLGIKNDKVSGGGLFKVFQSQSKGDEKMQVQEASTVLQANPAAMSRSLNFQENS